MSLIKCEECGKQISENSTKCVHCGVDVVKKYECEECKKKTEGKDGICEFCGCPIKTTEKLKKGISKNKIIIIVALAVLVIGGIVAFFLIKGNNEKKYQETYELLLQAYGKTETLVSDLYNSWHYGIYEDDHSKSSLALNVSLTSSELTSSYCSLLILDKWEYAVNCVRDSHEEMGHYNTVKTHLDNAKEKLSKLSNQKSDDYKMLNKFYVNLQDYYKMAKEYNGSFNSLQTDKAELIKELKNNVSELDFMLDYDSEGYLSLIDSFEDSSI